MPAYTPSAWVCVGSKLIERALLGAQSSGRETKRQMGPRKAEEGKRDHHVNGIMQVYSISQIPSKELPAFFLSEEVYACREYSMQYAEYSMQYAFLPRPPYASSPEPPHHPPDLVRALPLQASSLFVRCDCGEHLTMLLGSLYLLCLYFSLCFDRAKRF